jgi:NitT/TauT family transport system substrate-binding protein
MFLTAGPRNDVSSPLRVGVLPDADSLPFMLARDFDLYKQEGVNVELIVFSSPLERDAAIQAGRLDGAVSDLLAAAFLAQGGYDYKVTSLTDGRYGIVSSPQSGINSLTELRGKRIALSVNTIIQYTVDAQLKTAGIDMNEYEAVAVPGIPMRLEMLLNSALDAASLPEPLLSAAAARGALLVSTTESSGIDAGVLLLTKKTLDNRLDDVKAFYRAYQKAALYINSNHEACRDYLVEQAGFPAAVRDAYRFVHYRKPSLSEDSQIEDVFAWLRARRLFDAALNPGDITDSRAIVEWLN